MPAHLSARLPKSPRSRSRLLALEPRYLFDGVALTDAPHDPSHLDTPQVLPDTAPRDTTTVAIKVDSGADRENIESSASVSSSNEFLFIDPQIANYEELVAAARPGVKVIVLDDSRDGMEQIAEALQDQSNVTAIHLVTHGNSGEFYLGNTVINQASLEARSDDLIALRQKLSANADILIYGCDVAQNDAGRAMLRHLADYTGADVAASSNPTGNESGTATGADWNLEYQVGQIDTLAFLATVPAAFDGRLSTIALNGSSGWTAIMFGAAKDPDGDSQAGAADTDIIGDAGHGSLYSAYDDNGTATTADDSLAFRMRIDNPTSTTSGSEYFGGVAIVGMDANQDGRIDIFMSVDGRNNTQAVRLLDPGTDANISPSTTSTSPLPTGWLPSNGIYPFSNTSIYNVSAVSESTDPHWGASSLSGGSNADLTGDGKADAFVSWKISMSDLATVLAKASPVDRSGVYGPRGATGIAGFTKDTTVSYVSFTQTQPGPINGDLNGIGASYDKNATFATLGAITAPMSASNPVSASAAVSITDPVDANGLINAAEDNAITINGTAAANGFVKLTISDSASGTATVYATADSAGSWTVSSGDLSSLADGTLTFTAQLVTASGGSTVVTGSSGDTATAIHDTTPPIVGVAAVATGTPTISGTSTDVPVGSNIMVGVDLDNNGTIDRTYTAIVASGGAWSVNTATVAPATGGALPSAGITSAAKVTATGSDAAGNSATSTAIIRPIVNVLTTNDTTPTITGSWAGTNGGTDSLTVRINGVDYTTAGGNLSITGTAWSLTIPDGNALTTGSSPYDVLATVTRSTGGNATDTSSSELTLVSGPTVVISGITDNTDKTPVINGTSTESYVVVQVDPDNNPATDNSVTYTATVSSGHWSIDTGNPSATQATLTSGNFPTDGITGTFDVFATATASNDTQATANGDFSIVAPSIAIVQVTGANTTNGSGYAVDSILNDAEDDSVTISGTAENLDGQAITISVADGTTTKTLTPTVSGGAWTATFNAGSGQLISALMDGSLTVTASKDSTNDTMIVAHDATHPVIQLTTPTILSKSNPEITGISDLAVGATLTVTITQNSNSSQFASSTTQVLAGGNWSWFANAGNWPTGTDAVTITATSAATDMAGNGANSVTFAGQDVSNGQNFTSPTITISQITGIDAASSDNSIVSSDVGTGTTGISISGGSSILSGAVSVSVAGAGASTVTFPSVSTSAAGAWSVTLTEVQVKAFSNGTLTVTASATNSDGTATDVALPNLALSNGVGQTIAIDGPIGDGNLSASEDGPGLSITGTATNAIGQTITLVVTDGASGTTGNLTAVVGSNGTWTVSNVDLSALANGTLTATATLGALSDPQTVLHDKTPPVVHVTAGPTVADSTPLITGTTDLAAGSTVVVAIDSDANGSTDVTYHAAVRSGSGLNTWSVNTETASPYLNTFPAAGLTTSSRITATATDAAGNVGTVVADAVASISSDSGLLATDFVTNDRSLIFSGKAEAGSSVVVKVDDAQVGSTQTADGSGNWTLDYSGTTLATGSHTLTVIATNAAGNSATATQAFTIDITAPAVAITSISHTSPDSADTGDSGTDYVTKDNTLVFNGTAEANSSVLVTLMDASNATVFTTTVTATGGNWSVDRSGSALVDGTYTLSATATDSAGNQATATQAIVVDTVATIGITSNSKTNDTTPVITGSSDLEVGRTITVEIDPNNDGTWTDKQTYGATVQTGGSWAVDATTVLSGTVGVRAIGTDLAGNSVTTATRSLIIDTNAPGIAVTEPVSGVGADGTANATEDNAITIAGSTTNVSSGSTVVVTVTDGTRSIRDTTTVSGVAWTLAALDLSGFNDGTVTVNASYTDDSGNTYLDTAAFQHDKTPPAATLTAATTAITGATTVTITFAEAVTDLELSDFATSNGATVSNLAGNGSTYTLTLTPLYNGTASIWMPIGGTATAGAIDVAGNKNAVSNTLSFTVSGKPADTSAPTVISIARQTPSDETSNADSVVFRVTFSEAVQNVDTGDFTLSAGGSTATVTNVNAISTSVYDVTVSGGDLASYTGTVNLDFAGSPTITDSATNALTNTTPSSEQTYTLDNIAPAISTATISYSTITLTYTEANSGFAGTTPATSAFAVTKNSTPITVNSVSVNTTAKTVTLSLASAVASTDTVSLTYTAPGTSPLQDIATNPAITFTRTLTNNTPVADTTAPVIDLDPSNSGTLNHAVTSANGAAVSLDDNSDNQATLVESSDKLTRITLTVSGLQSADAANEKLIFGSTTVAANGSNGAQLNKTVGGIAVDINYGGGTFTITRADYQPLTAAQAQGIIRDIQYQNVAGTATAGNRTFAFGALDDAGNTSATATTTVNVTVGTDNSPVINDATVAIDENSANGTVVLDVNAVGGTAADKDADGQSLTYSITAGNALGAFAINAATGAITVADATKLDYETTSSFTLTVSATDGTNSDTAAITINLNNLNDNAPNIVDATVAIDENSANATSVYNVSDSFTSSDLDRDGAAITYSITAGNASGAFAINAATGAITVADATKLDYETTSSFTLTVSATDGTNSDTAAITINLNNLNDNAPNIVDATVAIDENSANATAVTNVSDSFTSSDFDRDGAAITYSITAGNALGAFAINAATGAITVADATKLDYETTSSFTLTVSATDGTNSDTAAITINLNNLPEVGASPVINDATVAINENLANGSAVYDVNAVGGTTDDKDADGEALTYSITAGNALGGFAINAATGAITVADATKLDYETTSSFTLTVSATDGTNSDTAAITINLNNLNDTAPLISSNGGGATATISINEGTTAVTTAAASDADGSTPTYTISGGSDHAKFTIDATTGVLAFASAPDYEAPTDSDSNNTYVVNVTATDGTNTDVQAITVTVLNLNDNPVALTDSNAGVNIVAENATIGTTVGITALGVDADPGTSVTYELTDTAGDKFAINASTGVVTVNGALDYESATSHTITVKATSSDGSITSGNFVIAVSDYDEIAPDVAISSITTDSGVAADFRTNDQNLIIAGSFNAADTNVLTVSLAGTTYTLGSSAQLTAVGNVWTLNATGVTLAEGTYPVVATATDVAGNTATATQAVVIDTNAPGANGDGTAPAITGISDDSNITTDYITNNQTLTFHGTAGANEVVTVKLDGNTLGTATANGSGVWSYDHTGTTLANGTYSLTASTTDVAGNTATATQAVVIDTNAPGANGDGTAPAITSISTDSNVITDFITNDQTLVFNGTAGASEVVTIKLDGTTLGTATANGSGAWSYNHTATTLANGTYSLTASTTDVAGNTATATQAVVIDTNAPTTPTVNSLVTIDQTPTLTGNAVLGSGETLTVSVGGMTYTVGDGHLSLNAATGSWTLAIPASHGLGIGQSYDVVATVRDTAGNTATDASSSEVTVLAPLPPAPPPPPVIDQPAIKVQAETAKPSTEQAASSAKSGGSSSVSLAGAEAGTGDVGTRMVIRAVTPIGSQLAASGQGGTPAAAKLESTDRGFPVERLQTDVVRTATVQDQQKGGERLFVYNGIKNITTQVGQALDYRVPKDAFGHTNTGAIVQLEASMSDGAPLPEWMDFDPISGTFSGKPSASTVGNIEVKVTARDDQGREVTANFKLQIENHRAQTQTPEKPAPGSGADAGGQEIEGSKPIKLAAEKPQPLRRGTIPFSDQLKLSKRDPLVERILSRQQTAARATAAQRMVG